MRVTRRYSALTAGVSYDLVRASRFTPYLKGGTGIYYTSFTRAPASGIMTTAEFLAYYQDRFSEKRVSLGVNGGLGLKARFGSREFFIEQMIHSFDPRRRGVTGVYPLNIGIRF